MIDGSYSTDARSRMPDLNKMKALKQAGFKVVPTCSTCVNFRCETQVRYSGGGSWGRCSAIAYCHGKHGGPPPEGVSIHEHKKYTVALSKVMHKMGVPNNGWCPQYELSWDDLEDHVNSYIEFYEEQEPTS